jgi:hypothetical protein
VFRVWAYYRIAAVSLVGYVENCLVLHRISAFVLDETRPSTLMLASFNIPLKWP